MLVSRWHGARVAFTTVLVLCVASISSASITLNLTTAGSSGNINGAIYEQIDPQSTGTGTINSFAQIGGNTTQVEAYNTNVNNTLDNGNSPNFNHSITLADVPIVSILGLDYRQFLLDINENRGGGEIQMNFFRSTRFSFSSGGRQRPIAASNLSQVVCWISSGPLFIRWTLAWIIGSP